MVYVTVKLPPRYHQMTLEELLFDSNAKSYVINENTTATRTYEVEWVSKRMRKVFGTDIDKLIYKLKSFNDSVQHLRDKERNELYLEFYMEKKNGGMGRVFKEMFKTQEKLVECNTGYVCKTVATILHPMIICHEASQHAEIVEKCKKKFMNCLNDNGFDTSLVDFDKIISSAFRRIDAPKDELMLELRKLKAIFENDFKVLYHTSAFAYIKRRSTLDAVKKHQENESRWFGKYDLSNFFGSTTVDFIIKMFSMVYPFSEVVMRKEGKEELIKAIELATLDGVLPQGTPISPLITNVMMIPIDYKLSNGLRDFDRQRFVYTRYADDFLISSKYDFDVRKVEDFIVKTLAEFDAPFTIKAEKTRYGSSAGSNWNLGVMLNKDNEITVGFKKKREFQAMLASYVKDTMGGMPWDKSDVQVMEGYRNYYRMVEGETIDRIVSHIGTKFGVDIVSMIKSDLSLSA